MSEHERKVNDVGGLEAGAVDRHEHDPSLFEKRVDALLMLLSDPRIGAFRVDAMRRAVEQNSPEDYYGVGYYEKWIRAIRDLLVEQELITPEEVNRKMDEVRQRIGEASHG